MDLMTFLKAKFKGDQSLYTKFFNEQVDTIYHDDSPVRDYKRIDQLSMFHSTKLLTPGVGYS